MVNRRRRLFSLPRRFGDWRQRHWLAFLQRYDRFVYGNEPLPPGMAYLYRPPFAWLWKRYYRFWDWLFSDDGIAPYVKS